MDENPFTMTAANRRVVDIEASQKAYLAPQGVLGVTAALWAYSMKKYHHRFFRINGNAFYLMSFGVASGFASYAYANFVFGSPADEAALKNNEREASTI